LVASIATPEQVAAIALARILLALLRTDFAAAAALTRQGGTASFGAALSQSRADKAIKALMIKFPELR
jgi:hypothetical protein